MIVFNVIILNQSKQNILVFNILRDLTLLLLVHLQFYSSMSDRLNFYFKQHKYFLKPPFDCFVTCSILKVTYNIDINNFDFHLKDFTLLTVYILLCLTYNINFLLVLLINRNGAGVACYIRNDIGYLQKLISKGNRKYFCLNSFA